MKENAAIPQYCEHTEKYQLVEDISDYETGSLNAICGNGDTLLEAIEAFCWELSQREDVSNEPD